MTRLLSVYRLEANWKRQIQTRFKHYRGRRCCLDPIMSSVSPSYLKWRPWVLATRQQWQTNNDKIFPLALCLHAFLLCHGVSHSNGCYRQELSQYVPRVLWFEWVRVNWELEYTLWCLSLKREKSNFNFKGVVHPEMKMYPLKVSAHWVRNFRT